MTTWRQEHAEDASKWKDMRAIARTKARVSYVHGELAPMEDDDDDMFAIASDDEKRSKAQGGAKKKGTKWMSLGDIDGQEFGGGSAGEG
jgi:hypothetical protein